MMNKDMVFHYKQQVEENMSSNLTSASEVQASLSSGNRTETSVSDFHYNINPNQKKKRNQPGNPDPEAEVMALSPNTIMARNRFICEVCNKGFQRDQNLQLHKRGHNLPWKLKLRSNKDIVRRKVYVCPEQSCVHHNPARALGDLTGIKKHFFRKHCEKKLKCDKCLKKYAVQSDWKAHSKTCGTKEYKCDCGILFSRRDSFITHRAFCDALAEESAKVIPNPNFIQSSSSSFQNIPPWISNPNPNSNLFPLASSATTVRSNLHHSSPGMSATALLQKAAQMGHTTSEKEERSNLTTTMATMMTSSSESGQWLYMMNHYHGGGEAFITGDEKNDVVNDSGGETRDFLGLTSLMSQNEILSFISESEQQQQHKHQD